MKFIRAIHATTDGHDQKNVTFGIDPGGNFWIATNTGNPDPSVKPEYFGFNVHTFTELTSELVKLSFAALRVKMTGTQFKPGWHGTEVNEHGIIHHTDAVSAYPPETKES